MFGFFYKGQRPAELREQINGLERMRDEQRDDIHRLNLELQEVRAAKKRELDETQHIVRMREEALKLDFERKCLANDRKREDAIGEVKDEYRDKMEAELNKQLERMQTMYSDILARLPKVSVRQVDSRHEDVSSG